MRQTRDIRPFDRVSLRSFGDVLLTQAPQQSLELEADEQVLRVLRTEVRGGILCIEADPSWHSLFLPNRRATLWVSTPSVHALEVSGAGKIVVDRLQVERLLLVLTGAGSIQVGHLEAQELDAEVEGAGTIAVAGRVTEQDISMPGAGAYQARDLESQVAIVRLSGVGKASVWVHETLDARLTGVGNLEYFGSPEVSLERIGIGALTHRGAR